jgi:hypothetical protein
MEIGSVDMTDHIMMKNDCQFRVTNEINPDHESTSVKSEVEEKKRGRGRKKDGLACSSKLELLFFVRKRCIEINRRITSSRIEITVKCVNSEDHASINMQNRRHNYVDAGIIAEYE